MPEVYINTATSELGPACGGSRFAAPFSSTVLSAVVVIPAALSFDASASPISSVIVTTCLRSGHWSAIFAST